MPEIVNRVWIPPQEGGGATEFAFQLHEIPTHFSGGNIVHFSFLMHLLQHPFPCTHAPSLPAKRRTLNYAHPNHTGATKENRFLSQKNAHKNAPLPGRQSGAHSINIGWGACLRVPHQSSANGLRRRSGSGRPTECFRSRPHITRCPCVPPLCVPFKRHLFHARHPCVPQCLL